VPSGAIADQDGNCSPPLPRAHEGTVELLDGEA
jgi:hypothetical protein